MHILILNCGVPQGLEASFVHLSVIHAIVVRISSVSTMDENTLPIPVGSMEVDWSLKGASSSVPGFSFEFHSVRNHVKK